MMKSNFRRAVTIADSAKERIARDNQYSPWACQKYEEIICLLADYMELPQEDLIADGYRHLFYDESNELYAAYSLSVDSPHEIFMWNDRIDKTMVYYPSGKCIQMLKHGMLSASDFMRYVEYRFKVYKGEVA